MAIAKEYLAEIAVEPAKLGLETEFVPAQHEIGMAVVIDIRADRRVDGG